MEVGYHQVIDDWHPEAEQLRAAALEMSFDVRGSYPGMRTESVDYLRDYAYDYLTGIGYPISYWPLQYNGAFQLCLAGDTTWVHADELSYAAVWFLTPRKHCVKGHGTAFYRDKETEAIRHRGGPLEGDYEEYKVISGKFNRLLIYDSSLYHGSKVPGFGKTAEDGRLTATFFWG